MELANSFVKELQSATAFFLRWVVIGGAAASLTSETPANGTRGDQSSSKQLIGNVYSGYYDFTVTEISAKVWAVCMVITISILIYAAFLSTIMAKLKGLNPEEEEDYFKKRSAGADNVDTVLRSIQFMPNIASEDAWRPDRRRRRR